MTVRRTEGEPHDHLTRLGNALLDELSGLDGSDGVRAIVILKHDERCATVLSGWESDLDAIAAMFAYLSAVMKAKRQDALDRAARARMKQARP